MENIFLELLTNGFVIYPKNGKFILKKEIVENNLVELLESEHETYELALEKASDLILEFKQQYSKHLEWVCIVRYNRGLGIEYRNIQRIMAKTKEEAHEIATELANEILNDPTIQILEIKIRLKN